MPAYADEPGFESADAAANVTVETTVLQEAPAEESTETSVPAETDVVTELPDVEETAPAETEQTDVIEVEAEEDMPELLSDSTVADSKIVYAIDTDTKTATVVGWEAALLYR